MPIAIVEGEDGRWPRVRRRVRKDEAVCYGDLELPESFLVTAFRRQVGLGKEKAA